MSKRIRAARAAAREYCAQRADGGRRLVAAGESCAVTVYAVPRGESYDSAAIAGLLVPVVSFPFSLQTE